MSDAEKEAVKTYLMPKLGDDSELARLESKVDLYNPTTTARALAEQLVTACGTVKGAVCALEVHGKRSATTQTDRRHKGRMSEPSYPHLFIKHKEFRACSTRNQSPSHVHAHVPFGKG